MAKAAKSAKSARSSRSQLQQFQGALSTAKRRHAEASAELAQHQSAIALLNIEIPNLELTIRALTAQLSGNANPDGGLPRISAAQPFVMPVRATGTDGVPVKLPEVTDSMGSVLPGAPADEYAIANAEPDLDALENFGGDFQ